jgi:hypothetical protein
LTSQHERFARNESLFREVNERIADVNEDFDVDGHTEFLCECGREDCLETVPLTRADYERVRGEGTRFVMKPGHEEPNIEVVLERHPDFLVVVKEGEAGEVSESEDPRD